MYSKVKQILTFIEDAFRDEQFYVALRHVLGAFIPLILGEIFGFERIGLELMLGAFFVSGVDIAGTFRSKASALFITTALSVSITFLLLIPDGRLWIILPLLFLFIFCLAFISPFSLRYMMMGVMGYIAIILAMAFVGKIHSLQAIIIHCLWLLGGAVWYSIYALVIHYFSGSREINRRVAFCMRQTADYFDKRLALLESKNDHQDDLLELARLQQQLNQTQEDIRKILLEKPSILTDQQSKYHQLFIIFIELVDMHELAMAAPIDYPQIRNLLHKYPEYNIIRKLIRQVNREMHNLADVLLQQEEYHRSSHLEEYVEQLHHHLQQLHLKTAFEDGDEDKEEVYHTFKRIEEYLDSQLQKLENIRQTVREPESENVDRSSDVAIEDLHHFVSPNPLNWNSVINNLNFKSSYFRYALRTAVTAVTGYAVASFLNLYNSYWVLLTVLLVMKPGYGATQQRFFHRTIGTVAGAIIGYGIYQFHPSHVASLVIFGVSFLIAFTFVVKNYAVATIFFTIFVIFLYSFLNRQIPPTVIYRVVDTILGAILAIGAIFYLWPHWEHQKFSYYFKKSLRTNKAYLQKVLNRLFDRTVDETSYHLARKQAHVNMANVVSSVNRLKEDPKEKQENIHSYYNLALLNYMLLSGISSLSVFVQHHPDDLPSDKQLSALGGEAINNLENALQNIEYVPTQNVKGNTDDIQRIKEGMEQKLFGLRKRLNQMEKTNENQELYTQYANLNHLNRQILWVLELSESIVEHAQQLNRIQTTKKH